MDFIHPDDRESTLKEIEKLAKGAPIVNFQNRYRTRDGQYHWLSWNANPSKGLVYAIARDVTEQRQINDALRESEEKYRTLFENTGLFTLIYNRAGIILLANKFTGERLGVEPTKLVGRSILDSFPPGQGQPYLERIQRVIDSGQGEITEDFTYWGSGDRWYLTNTQPIFDGAGKPIAALVISQDITAHKLAEKQQIELRLAQEKAAFLADFLGDMSHDLKTPLSIINNSIYLMERLNDPEKQRDQIQQIKNQTRMVEKFIQDILTVTQLENKPELNCQHVDINHLLTGIAGQLRAKAEQKHIRTSLHLNDELPPIWIDQDQMTRAFINLVENAINYTLDDGRVEIRTYAADNRVIVEIADTGIGIGKDDLPHVFERFYRSSDARSLEAGGTGLGLAIAKKIIDVHGCGIDVSSVPGEGTTFRVKMPVKV
jgi:two-component system phosphate regulon sensor histidine kinase PhoR